MTLALLASFAAAFVVLRSTINWPDSLDLPASEALPLVAAETTGLLVGYWLYFTYSLGIGLLAVLLPRALEWRVGLLATLTVVVGVLSAALRGLGIARWLLAMPALADDYVAAAPGSAGREAALVVYTTLNDYGGGVGEVLGVTLTGAAFALLVSLGIHRHGGPGWLVGLGLLAAGSLLPAVAVDAFSTIGTPFFLIWLGGLGTHLLRGPVRRAGGDGTGSASADSGHVRTAHSAESS